LAQHTGINQPFRVLHLEDNRLDAELIANILEDAGLDCRVETVQTRYGFQECLQRQDWDVILSDFGLPAFDGLSALAIAQDVRPTTPFIFVTGTMGEDNAVESLKQGATDYVLKGNLTRLAPAVQRALKERAATLQRLHTEAKLHQTQKQLQYLAYHDALTGLPNRAFLSERLPDMLADARRYQKKLAVLFIDLDQFKVINDSLGHSTGDQVLQCVADRLRGTVRQGDVVARLGGDEFVLVLRSMHEASDAAIAADRINHIVAAEITSEGHHALITTCSIGISIFPENGNDAESLIRNADAALYAAKDRGRNNWQFFTNDLNERAIERLTLEHALRHALASGEFSLEYQPQVEIATGRVLRAEALLRWHSAELGVVPPSIFIPAAESTGEIVRIGAWVLESACREAKRWERYGDRAPALAVNVSAVQFRDPGFLDTVSKALAESGLAPERLELELTETQLMQNAEKLAPLLQRLRDAGIGLAIDDFGIGYCGLSYIRAFPFSKLKIDQSFVRSILVTARDAALTRALINLASGLQMEVVAECVETADQALRLQSLGCKVVQGYLFSRPLPPEVLEERFLQGSSCAGPLLAASAAVEEKATAC